MLALLLPLALGACYNSAYDEADSTGELMDEMLASNVESIENIERLYAAGRVSQARQMLGQLLTVQAQEGELDPEALLLYGEMSLDLKRYNEARSALIELANTDTPYRAQALQIVGLAELGQGKSEEALGHLLEAVALDGSLWRAYNGIGVIYDTRSRFGDAAEAYATALTVKPEAAPVLNNFGVSLMQQERFAEAEPRFVRALAIDPEMTRAETNLRMARAMQGKYLEAFAGVSRENMPDALNDVGYAAMLRGDYDLAEAYLSRALEESPVYHKTAAENLESLRRLKEIERAPEGS